RRARARARHPAGSGAAGRHRVPARRHPRRRARRRGDGRRRRRAPPRGARTAQQGGPPPLARQRGRHAAGARRGTRGGRRVLHPRLHQRRLRAARTLPDHRPHAAPPAGGLRARQAGGRGARGRGRARRARLPDPPAARVTGVPAGLAIPALRLLDWLRLSPLAPWHYLTYHTAFFFDVSRAVRELEWRPRYGNAEMLVESYDWFLAHPESAGARSVHRSAVPEKLLSVLRRLS